MSRKDSQKISVVIPVYNSSACLPELVKQLTPVLKELGNPYEILLVDDSSPDNSWEVILQLRESVPELKGIQLLNNEGQAKATLCGLEHVTGDIVITMDDDLQHQPKDIPALLKALESDPELDCVMGLFEVKQHSAYRNFGSALIRKINAYAFGVPPGVRSSAFRVMRRRLANAIAGHQTTNPSIPVLLFGSTRRVKNVKLEHAPRFAGKSNYTIRKQLRLALDNITNATMLPLRLVSGLGLVICALSLVLIVWFLIRYLTGWINAAGWTTLVLLLSFFSGAILLSLGVIGEYLVRVLREVRRRPSYFIRTTIGDIGSD